jgi:ribosomal protein L7/L12
MQPRDLRHDLRKLTRAGTSFDAALGTLRANGASIIESIVAVRWVRGCDLAEAKRLVHASPVWADVAAQNEKLHEELEAAAREIESL